MISNYKFIKTISKIKTSFITLNVLIECFKGKLDSEEINEKLDSLINLEYLKECSLIGDDLNIPVSRKYRVIDKDNSIPNNFEITNEGHEFIYNSKDKLLTNLRSWLAIIISLIALLLSFLNYIFR